MYEQLYRYFVGEIHDGRMAQGEKLPSKRALCAHLGVSRSTVETAYGILAAEGYITAKPQSGFYISDFVSLDAAPKPAQVDTQTRAQSALPKPRGEFDFSTSSVDTTHFPYSSWAKLNKEVVYSSPELLQRGERQGDAALRNALAVFLSEYRGVNCDAEQIVVGAGMEYLTSLLLQIIPADAVFGMEDPGYASIYHTILNTGRSLRFIPLDEGGMSISALERSDVSVAYITPSHQFPMGITMPAGRRSQLLRWAGEKDGRYIIEDDYDSEFRYNSRPVPAMQSMDKSGRVVYIGTFSRSLAPSIRIAYIVLPPELLRCYQRLFGYSLSTVSRYEQAVMARFLSEGFYTRYLRRVGNLYRQRRAELVAALEEIDGVSISGSSGGLHFLLTNPHHSESELIRRAGAEGIILPGLSSYCRDAAPLISTLVVGYGGLDDNKITQAAEKLRRAWA
jgi:GntR family transcriptional regulator/MocR family aminotransferase